MQARNDRLLLLSFLSAFLFVGALRSFFASVYYHNLATLSMNATALYALALALAPAVLLLARPPERLLLALALTLGATRASMPLVAGSALYLPVAGLAALAFLALLPALARLAPTLSAAGIALGFALDAALVWWGRSADPTLTLSGELLVVPAALLLALAALGVREAPIEARSDRAPLPPWLAAVGIGAVLAAENAFLAPHSVARWNATSVALVAPATIGGLLLGAWLLARGTAPPRWLMLGANATLVAAVIDHAFLHTPLVPALFVGAQAALALDLAALLGSFGSSRRPTAASFGASVTLVLLHFVAVFVWVFAYVPFGDVWKGQEDTLIVATGVLVAGLALAGAVRAAAQAARPAAMLAAAPILVAAIALATPAATVPAAVDAEFTLMTFNVHQGFANDGIVRPALFADILRAWSPDVVVLQEADTPRPSSANVDMVGYLAATAGYHAYYGQPTRAQAFGGAVLSRYPIVGGAYVELPSGSDNRYFSEVQLAVGGRPVWVYAVHMGLPVEDRLAQAELLLSRASMREGAVVLAGDFNSCPDGFCEQEEPDDEDDIYARITVRYADAWVAAGNARDTEAGYTYDAHAPYQRIDYIFANGLDVVDAERVRDDDALAASDHLPVIATLRLR